jgi:predicted 3-demethylubiquinone-9 3-methyltransferase (glyoxalase superfamily)
MQTITPFLWFDRDAEEAAKLYVSVFKNSKITSVAYYPEGGPAPAGTVLTVTFELDGLPMIGLNAGPQYKFNPSFSLSIACETQAEVDHYWYKLSEGGRTDQCGWLTDKFGLSWQVVPNVLPKALGGKDKERAKRVMAVMMTMTKLIVKDLEEA